MTRVSRHPWYDVAWPAVAGLAVGVGLLSAYLSSGPLVTAIVLTILLLTIAPVTWCVLTELGHGVRGVTARIAFGAAFGVFALVGLGQVIGAWAFLVVSLVLVTSPLVRGWTEGGLYGSVALRVSPRAETRRRFDEIVAFGFGTPDEGLPPAR